MELSEGMAFCSDVQARNSHQLVLLFGHVQVKNLTLEGETKETNSLIFPGFPPNFTRLKI